MLKKTLCELGKLERAIELLDSIAHPKDYTVCVRHVFRVLQHCINTKDLTRGRQVHSIVKKIELESNAFIGTHLIRLFHACKSLTEAKYVFGKIREKNVFVWSAIISAHAALGEEGIAMDLFCKMEEEESHLKPDRHVFVAALKACSNQLYLRQGKMIHSSIVEHGFEDDVFVCSILVDLYTKCNCIIEAQAVFDGSESKDLVLWNAMIAGNLQEQRAFNLFEQMQIQGIEPNAVSFINILKSCSLHRMLRKGRTVHSCIIHCSFTQDLSSLTNTLIDMYAKCGDMAYAQRVFDGFPNRDVVSWNVMISGYAQNRCPEETLLLFNRMHQEGIEPNNVTFNTMIAAHSEHGYFDEAVHLFHRMQKEGFLPDIVTWNTFLSSEVQQGEDQIALQVFREIVESGISPNKVTFLSILKACSNLVYVHEGQICNHIICECGFEPDPMVATALIDMYTRCGSLQHAKLVFENARTGNVVMWSALIGGFVQCGEYTNALKLFGDMQREGLKPNDVTFVSILSACSHAGLIDEGYAYFLLLQKGYDITVTIHHYNCLVDLLGASGYLSEAQGLLLSMPLEHNVIGWTCLLNHCRKHREAKIARQCFESAVSIDCRHASLYSIMSSIYADLGMWEDAKQILTMEARICIN